MTRRLPLLCWFTAIAVTMVAVMASVAGARPFADHVGVNVHVSYGDTVYTDIAKVREKVAELGVGRCRDGLPLATQEWVKNRQATLPCDLTLIYGDQHLGKSFPAPPANTSLHEGLNEYDYPPRPSEGWLPQLQAHQALIPRPSVAPSFVYASSYPKCGCPADFANGHPYPGGQWETTSHAQSQLDLSRSAVDAPALATEWGYHTTEPGGWYAAGHPPVTEAQQRDRTIAGILELVKVGWDAVYLYELVDLRASNHQEHRFGLYRNDWTAKPVATALAWWTARAGTAEPATATDRMVKAVGGARWSEWVLPDGRHLVAVWRTGDGSGLAEVWANDGTTPHFSVSRPSGYVKSGRSKGIAFTQGAEPTLVTVTP